jgi:hypothetical protein
MTSENAKFFPLTLTLSLQGRENEEILRQAQNERGKGIRMSGIKKITAMLNDYGDYICNLKIK